MVIYQPSMAIYLPTMSPNLASMTPYNLCHHIYHLWCCTIYGNLPTIYCAVQSMAIHLLSMATNLTYGGLPTIHAAIPHINGTKNSTVLYLLSMAPYLAMHPTSQVANIYHNTNQVVIKSINL